MLRLQLMAGVSAGILLAATAGAQSSATNHAPQEMIANGGLLHTLLAAPVTGQPYSAEQVMHMKRVLADGTAISRNGHHAVARDSQGRMRVEHRVTNGSNGQPAMSMIFVLDPVAHTLTTWVTGGPAPKSGVRVASVVQLPQRDNRQTRPAAIQSEPSTRPQPIVTTEDLGTDLIDGVMVTVSKTTTIVPAGRSGNDAPITKTHEVWTSPDLKLTLKEQWEDPRSGERTVELDQFSRTEPEAALFRAPPDYQVKNALESLREMTEKLEQSQQN